MGGQRGEEEGQEAHVSSKNCRTPCREGTKRGSSCPLPSPTNALQHNRPPWGNRLLALTKPATATYVTSAYGEQVPDSVTDAAAVFVEPLAAACRILEQGLVPPGADAAVLGDGKLGLLIAEVLARRTTAASAGEGLPTRGEGTRDRHPPLPARPPARPQPPPAPPRPPSVFACLQSICSTHVSAGCCLLLLGISPSM